MGNDVTGKSKGKPTDISTGISKTSPHRRSVLLGLGAFGLASACAEKDVILPGERLDIRGGALDAVDAAPQARPISLAQPVANADWTHRNGGPTPTIAHPALGAALAPAFSVGIK